MAVRKPGRYEEYRNYAEHCLKLVRIATSRKNSYHSARNGSRMVQAGRYVLCCGAPAE